MGLLKTDKKGNELKVYQKEVTDNNGFVATTDFTATDLLKIIIGNGILTAEDIII